MKVYNLVDIIENIILLCNKYMKLKKTNLIFDPQDEEVYILCDKDYIERIMLNILSNSLKYGKINGNIYVRILKNHHEIKIQVTNDAKAIPEDKRKVIFEKFTRIDSSLNRPSEGSGLGLFLTKGLVELHKGEIYIYSGKNIGNTFTIILPYEKIQYKNTLSYNPEINQLEEKVDIEFSDIYF
ncbi:sensor histidine kinase [Clostridium carnis]